MIYCILGQTASGKTGVSLKICKELGLPLIGGDVYQMYKELNIGSAKPREDELEGVVNHCINDISVEDEMSVFTYQKKAREILDYYVSKNQDVVVSGGTFLYIRSLFYPYEFKEETVKIDESKYDSYSNEELFEMLKEKDFDATLNLHMNNRRRVIRALEIASDGSTKKSEMKMKKEKLLYPVTFLAIDIDRDEVNEKINKRVDEMVDEGLFEEVEELKKKFDTSSLKAFEAIGYKEILDDSLTTKEEKIEKIKLDTRQYAKRQRTFLRHQFKNIKFLSKEDIYKYVVYDHNRRLRNNYSLEPKYLKNIEKSEVAVVGVGGVGSIVALALVRLGVRNITLVDKDTVDVTNLNRQLAYDKDDIGRSKVEALKDKLLKIDPLLNVEVKEEMYNEDSLSKNLDFVFDCIDDVPSKCDLYSFAKENEIKIIHATGSGLRKDSTFFTTGTLEDTGEPLSKKFKRELKARGVTNLKEVNIAYSKEVPMKRVGDFVGSNVVAPNSEGLAMVSYFIKNI